MDRRRDERFMGAQGRQPGETSGLHQHSEGSERLSTDTAVAYLKLVQNTFEDNKEKYDQFLEVMKAFKAHRIDTAGVIARVRYLFKGHHSLILGFNIFLPEGYEITFPFGNEGVDLSQAISYLNKIKKRFRNDEEVYTIFLDILKMHVNGSKSIDEVYKEMQTLFYDHEDLMEEFAYFLPKR